MNYGNLIYFFVYIYRFFLLFIFFWNILLYIWCVLYYKLLFLLRLSGSVSFSVYKDILKMLFTFFEKCPEVWTIFVRTLFLSFFGIYGILNGPPTPIPGVNVKVPFWGKIWGKQMYFYLFLSFFAFFFVILWVIFWDFWS